MRERTERAHGPYRRGNKWRVVETSATGAKSTCSFESEAEALAYIAEYHSEAQGRTVSAAVDAYVKHLHVKPGTITTTKYNLKAILQTVTRDRLLTSVTPRIARDLYAARVVKVKPDTHHGELVKASAMFAWCVEQGWIRENPFAEVKPDGEKKRRRVHLRIDEARAFLDAALDDATDAGLACALALLLGLRASEVTNLLVRDVDNGATVLWIADAKTEAGVRKLEIPSELRARLTRKVDGRPGDQRLFAEPRARARGDVDRYWLGYHVRRICRLAKVPIVSPHALRRTWSAIGAEAMPVHAVSRALGHASVKVTRRHYQPTNAEEQRTSNTVLRSIAGGKAETGTPFSGFRSAASAEIPNDL